MLLFLFYIIVGVATGTIVNKFTRGHETGYITHLAIGIVGALVGGFVVDWLDIPTSPYGGVGHVMMSVAGAVSFLVASGFFTEGPKSRKTNKIAKAERGAL